MRRFAQAGLFALATLLVPACSEYLPNHPDPLPEAGPPQTDRGLVVEITSNQARVSQEGEVVFTVTTTGGGGNYRYAAWVEDCYQDLATGRERCTYEPILGADGGQVLTFTRYRRAIDTKLKVSVQVRELSTAKSGEDVHYLVGPYNSAGS